MRQPAAILLAAFLLAGAVTAQGNRDAAQDAAYAKAVMRTLAKYEGQQIPEKSILWLSRTFRQPIPQVMRDLGVSASDYVDEGEATPPEEVPPAEAPPPPAADPEPEPAPPSPPRTAPPRKPPEPPSEEKYKKALLRTLEKYAWKVLPPGSMSWLTKTFSQDPEDILGDLRQLAQESDRSPPAWTPPATWAPPPVNPMPGRGLQPSWRKWTPIRRQRPRPSLSRKQKPREGGAAAAPPAPKPWKPKGYGSLQFHHWGGIQKPMKFLVDQKIRLSSIPRGKKKPPAPVRCVSNHPETAHLEAGEHWYKEGWANTLGHGRKVTIRAGECRVISYGAALPTDWSAGLESAAGVGTHVVKPAPKKPPPALKSQPSPGPGTFVNDHSRVKTAAGASEARIRQLTADMQAAAMRGDMQRYQQILQQIMKEATAGQDLDPSSAAMMQNLQRQMQQLQNMR